MFPPNTVSDSYVLVIEDDPALRAFYRSLLTGAGFPVVAVEDGLQALRKLETSIPSAVILDLELPRVGGRDVYHELRAHPDTAQLPIIVVTGDDVSDLDPKQFACILKKPINADELVEAVRKCLRKAADSH